MIMKDASALEGDERGAHASLRVEARSTRSESAPVNSGTEFDEDPKVGGSSARPRSAPIPIPSPNTKAYPGTFMHWWN